MADADGAADTNNATTSQPELNQTEASTTSSSEAIPSSVPAPAPATSSPVVPQSIHPAARFRSVSAATPLHLAARLRSNSAGNSTTQATAADPDSYAAASAGTSAPVAPKVAAASMLIHHPIPSTVAARHPDVARHAKEAADAAAAAAAAAKSRPSSAFYPSSTTPPPPPGVVANVAATASSLPSFLPSSSSSSSSAGSANAAASPPFHGASQKPPPQAGGIFLPLAAEDDPPEELIPCENFALVCKGVYRSAFPKKKNFPFLKRLRLKSVLTLILEEYPEQNQRFLEENDISFFQFGVAGNKEPFVDIPEETICAALTVIMDRRNHPLLIHCNKGKHRTGCLVGCLRKLQTWSYTSIFDEYRRFSHPKSRVMDQQFIELFDERAVVADPRWLPAWPEIADSPCRATLRVLPDPGEEEPGRRDEVRGSRVVVVVGLQ